MDSSGKKVIVTGVFGKEFTPPQTLMGMKLLESAKAIGLDEKNNVYFKGESSGKIQIVPVAEKTMDHILSSAKQCSIENCKNRTLRTNICWEHS